MNHTTCATGVDRLMDNMEGLLPVEVRAAIDAHVAQCERCAAFIASYRETPRIIRDATSLTLPVERQAALRLFLLTHRRAGPGDTKH